MSNSFADQFLKAGLVDEKKAKKANKAKQRQQKLERHGNVEKQDEVRSRVKQATAEQVARDRDLNRARHDAAQRKALQDQIRHLIDKHRIVAKSDEITYNFTHDGKVKSIHVDETTRTQLTRGKLAIVALEGKYETVPIEVADKIAERDAVCVVVHNDTVRDDDPNDPYADYQVPDDLMW